MCGIAGVIGTLDGSVIERMTASLRHRGPDGRGQCSWGNSHVGATRLSIIDPSSGPQPIYNETKDACIVFNGEIYNHRELRADLQTRGHVFRTATDTEVILHLYEDMGDDFVRHLHGMFAFAILDGSKLILARDRLGIKPLYYAFVSEAQLFIFASEIKAILQHPAFTPRLNTQALANYLVLTHPVGDETFFEGLKCLPCGHTMTVACGNRIELQTPKPYYRREFVRDDHLDFDYAQEKLEEALRRAVETHLVADVEVGLTLSGGLDSTVLGLLAHEHLQRPLVTFTVGDHEGHPDVIQAGLAAKMIGSQHHSILMSFEDYLAGIPGLIAAEEQPTSLFGMSFYFLCAKIAQRVKACLHGEGADELFGGYTDYLDPETRITYIRNRLPILKRLGVPPSDHAIFIAKQLSSARDFHEYLPRLFEINMSDPLERQHLSPVDKCAMASSLEIRVPYLDDSVVELVNRMPIRFLVRSDLGIRKYIMRRFALKRFGLGLTDIVLREKLGAPSSGGHSLGRFNQLCNEMLPDDYLENHEYGYCFTSKRQLLLFEMFLEIFMKHRGNAGAVGGVVDFIRERAGGSQALRQSNA